MKYNNTNKEKMLKHAHNPSIEIRQSTRHIIKEEEKKLAVCLRAGRLFSFLFLFLTLFR
jgi:hypothetical protein